jgi:NitT/TauT family transport system substrate-binding protein
MLQRALRRRGMTLDDVKLVEMPPPDMPAALSNGSVDAISSGEPFMGQAEMDGYGRVLYQAKDEWPGFISCVLAVREDVIRDRRPQVQELVEGSRAAASGSSRSTTGWRPRASWRGTTTCRTRSCWSSC